MRQPTDSNQERSVRRICYHFIVSLVQGSQLLLLVHFISQDKVTLASLLTLNLIS